METWRTSCPRLTIWEDAVDRQLVERRTIPGRGVVVTVTAQGLEFLANDRLQHEAGVLRPLRLS